MGGVFQWKTAGGEGVSGLWWLLAHVWMYGQVARVGTLIPLEARLCLLDGWTEQGERV